MSERIELLEHVGIWDKGTRMELTGGMYRHAKGTIHGLSKGRVKNLLKNGKAKIIETSQGGQE